MLSHLPFSQKVFIFLVAFLISGSHAFPQIPWILCLEDEEISLPDNHQLIIGDTAQGATLARAHLKYVAQLINPCGDALTYQADLILENDSVAIPVIAPTVISNPGDTAELLFDSRLSPDNDIRLNGIRYNSRYCISYGSGNPDLPVHHIRWTISNACDSVVIVSSTIFRIEDCTCPELPEPQGYQVPSSEGQEVIINAKDFVSSTIDDGTQTDSLIFSFSGSQYAPTAKFACSCMEVEPEYPGQPCYDEGLTCGKPRPDSIWVADGGYDRDCSGIITWDERNSCAVIHAIFQDSFFYHCGNVDPAAVRVRTYYNRNIGGFTAVKTSVINGNSNSIDGDCGEFLNTFCSTAGDTLRIVKLGNSKNGVSTLDIIRLLKHLLGIQPFESPYLYIASDVNNNGVVNALDIIVIRKLILGLIDDEDFGPSYKFIPNIYTFPDPEPGFYKEYYIYQETGQYSWAPDFTAVKMADLNKTVSDECHGISGGNSVRTRAPLKLSASDIPVQAGERYSIPVTCSGIDSILGIQLSIEFSNSEIEIVPGALQLKNHDLGMLDGVTTISTMDLDGIDLQNSKLFTIKVIPHFSGMISEFFTINSSVTQAEAYALDESIYPIDFAWISDTPNTSWDVTIFPNPASGDCTVNISGKVKEDSELSIFTLDSKVVFHQACSSEDVIIPGNAINTPGTYIVQIRNGENVIHRKLLRM